MAGDLAPTLKEIFSNGRDYLKQLGRLATGRADEDSDDDYAYLPGQEGAAGYPVENDIAMFFHDGGMLVGAADKNFNKTIEAAYNTIKPRIVDQALVTGGFFIWANEVVENEDDCNMLREEDDGQGQTWVDDKYCMRLMRASERSQACGLSFCAEEPATQEDHDLLEDKYGFDLSEYYKAALDCAINGDEDEDPDLDSLSSDGAFPRCWFGIEAKWGRRVCDSTGRASDCGIEYSDFPN